MDAGETGAEGCEGDGAVGVGCYCNDEVGTGDGVNDFVGLGRRGWDLGEKWMERLKSEAAIRWVYGCC